MIDPLLRDVITGVGIAAGVWAMRKLGLFKIWRKPPKDPPPK